MILTLIVILLVLIIIHQYRNLEEVVPGVYEGDNIKCISSRKIFKIENGCKRQYKTQEVFCKYGKPKCKMVECRYVQTIKEGQPMN